MIRSITLSGKNVQYNYQQKNVKNINLRIKSDQSIHVSANPCVPLDTIEEFLVSKSQYILDALQYYEELRRYSPQPKQYIDGETITVLGHDRRIRLLEGIRNTIESDMSYIYLTVKNKNDYDARKRTIEKWMHGFCKETINKVCENVYPKFKKYDIGFPEIRYRNMISRWGSCQPKRNILTFNYQLIEAPMFCIEYVVTHEFTHFLYPNHSKLFYQQLSMFMPDWKDRKEVLERSSLLKE